MASHRISVYEATLPFTSNRNPGQALCLLSSLLDESMVRSWYDYVMKMTQAVRMLQLLIIMINIENSRDDESGAGGDDRERNADNQNI